MPVGCAKYCIFDIAGHYFKTFKQPPYTELESGLNQSFFLTDCMGILRATFFTIQFNDVI